MAGEKMSRSEGSTTNGNCGRNTTRPCSSSAATLATGLSSVAAQQACGWVERRLTALLRRPTATAAVPARCRQCLGPLHLRREVGWVSATSLTRGVLPSACAFPVAHALWRVFRAWVWSDLPRVPPQVFSKCITCRCRGGETVTVACANAGQRRTEKAERRSDTTDRRTEEAGYLVGSAKAVAVKPDGRKTHCRPSIMYVVGGPKTAAPVW